MEKLYNVREAAEALKVSVHTIRQWCFQRKIPIVRMGRKVLFKEKDLIDMVDKGYSEAKAI